MSRRAESLICTWRDDPLTFPTGERPSAVPSTLLWFVIGFAVVALYINRRLRSQ